MELYQLRYFRAIANFGSMSTAATELNVTQPTLSYAITQLEKELGVSLFTRRNGKLQLSSTGALLLKTVNDTLQQLDECVEHVRSQGTEDAGRIYIGIAYNGLISDALTSYILQHPNIHLYETLPYLDTAEHSLEIKAVDFLVTYEQYPQAKVIQIPLFQDHLTALVRADNPLAQKNALCIQDLQDQKVIYKGIPKTLMGLLSMEAKVVTPEIEGIDLIYEGTDENIGRILAEQGLGIMLLPKSELEWRRKNALPAFGVVPMVAVPFQAEKYAQTIYLTFMKNTRWRKQALKAAEYILQYYTGNSDALQES